MERGCSLCPWSSSYRTLLSSSAAACSNSRQNVCGRIWTSEGKEKYKGVPKMGKEVRKMSLKSFALGWPCCRLSQCCLHNGPFSFRETKKYLMILRSRSYELVTELQSLLIFNHLHSHV